MRVVITDGLAGRFRITENDMGASLSADQLDTTITLADYTRLLEDRLLIDKYSIDKQDHYEYTVSYSPFRIEQRINGISTLILNDADTLHFEDYSRFYPDDGHEPSDTEVQDDCYVNLINKLDSRVKDRLFGHVGMNQWVHSFKSDSLRNDRHRQSFFLGFKLNSEHLFGLPERSEKFLLRTTDEEGRDPYRLFNVDLFPHDEWNPQGLYRSIPYLTSHSANHAASILWYNSAETWVDLRKGLQGGMIVNFMSETGQMEVFLTGSAASDAPKRV